MNSFKHFKFQTSVKKAFTIFICLFSFTFHNFELSLVASAHAQEKEDKKDEKKKEDDKKEDKYCNTLECICSKDALQEAINAQKEIENACGDSGFGSKTECLKKVYTCAKVVESESFDTATEMTNAVLQGLGLSTAASIGRPNKNTDNACPQFTADNYQKRKKEIQDDIKSIEKELKDLQKDLVKEEKDTKKELQDITDDITKAKKDVKDQKVKIDEDERKQLADFNNTQNQTKNQMRTSNMNILKLRAKLVESQRDLSQKLLQLNDNATKAACVNNAQKSYAEFQKAANSGSMSMALRTQQKQNILNQYSDCLKAMDQQRAALLESKREEQKQLQASITQANDEMTDIQHSLDLAQTQLDEIKAQNTTQRNELEKGLLEQMQNAQTKMQSIQSSFQKQQQLSQQQQAQLTQKLNTRQNELNSLGPVPASDATLTPTKAGTKIRGNLAPVQRYVDQCCDKKEFGRSCGTFKDIIQTFKTAEANRGDDDDDSPKSSRSKGGGK